MDEQINSESNNLRVHQESFENLQVVNMYQGDNFSEITPASSTKTGQVNSKNNLLFETEVEISSTVDDQSVNSETKSYNDTKISSGTNTENKILSGKGAKLSRRKKTTDIKTKNKKRNTKKQKDILQYGYRVKSGKKSQAPKFLFKEMPEKPINSKDEVGEDIRDSHVSTTQETSECLEDDNSIAKTNNRFAENILKKKPLKKRGKSKKEVSSDNITPSINAENQIIESSTGQNIIKRKRGRPKKEQNKEQIITIQKPVNEAKTTSECIVSGEKLQESTSVQDQVLEKIEMNVTQLPENLETNLPLTIPKANKVYSPRKLKRCAKNKHTETNPYPFQEQIANYSDKSLNETETTLESVSEKGNSDTEENLNESLTNDINCVNVSNENPNEDESEDICLSKLKKSIEVSNKNDNSFGADTENQTTSQNDAEIKDDSTANGESTKRNSRMPLMSDFEYNIDSIVTDTSGHLKGDKEKSTVDDEQPTTSFLGESSSGRPLRRKKRKVLHYDEGSDEDPFANVELSDDDGEPRRSKKSNRYFSDDEYIPGTKRGRVSTSDTADSDIDKKEEDVKKIKRKKSNSKSPKKRGKKHDLSGSQDSPENSVIKIDDDNVNSTNEFENFLAKKIQGTNLKIKRVSNVETRAITPLEIPVIDQTTQKSVETATQTNIYKTKTTEMQTVDSYDIPMKTNVTLSVEQSEKACAFLKDIVKTTSELGELMIQKSENFIQKKINTKHVTDTFKMDYCVQKSFLLFKLAKHNLMQMEEDLSKQYENFLTENNLAQYRDQPKSIVPSSTVSDDDSDCEIVEESPDNNRTMTKNQSKPKFNLRTVFLNKELSIKIAKKPSEEKKIKDKINIKGKNPVWISDSVLVKKVKPMQSFLAQDSRNKKPPDTYVNYEMVNNFFKNYYQQNASIICAPFVSPEWRNFKKSTICCNYFHVEPILFSTCANRSNFQRTDLLDSINTPASNERNENSNSTLTSRTTFPKTLFFLCLQAVQKEMYKNDLKNNEINSTITHSEIVCEQSNKKMKNPKTLFTLCVQIVIKGISKNHFDNCNQKVTYKAYLRSEIINGPPSPEINSIGKYPKTLFSLCVQIVQEMTNKQNCKKSEPIANLNKVKNCKNYEQSNKKMVNPKTLFTLCFQIVIKGIRKNNFENCGQKDIYKTNSTSKIKNGPPSPEIKRIGKYPKTLSSLCVQIVREIMNNQNSIKSDPIANLNKVKNCKRLSELCLIIIRNRMNSNDPIQDNILNTHTTISTPLVQQIIYPLKTMSFNRIIQSLFLTKIGVSICHNNNLNKPRMCLPKCLRSLCLDTIRLLIDFQNNNDNRSSVTKINMPKSLKYITYTSLIEHFFTTQYHNSSDTADVFTEVLELSNTTATEFTIKTKIIESPENKLVKQIDKVTEMALCDIKLGTVETLFEICLKTILCLFNNSQRDNVEYSIQINSVNTVPEEIFVNLQHSSNSEYDNAYFDNEESNCYADEAYDNQYEVDHYQEETNLESKPDLHLLTNDSSYTPTLINPDNNCDLVDVKITRNMGNKLPDLAMVKIEPLENDILYNEDDTFIKTEPTDILEEANYMPQIENVIAKEEKVVTQNLSCEFGEEVKVFSQSSLRVRKQFEPDSDTEAENTMSLLIPQGYESFNINKNKDSETNILNEKCFSKKNTLINKKQEKRKANTRSVSKKGRNIVKDGQVCNEKIRHDNCEDSSHDSESDASVNLRNQRRNKDNPAKKPEVKYKDKNEAKETALVNKVALLARQEENDKIKEKDNKTCSSDSDSSTTKILNLRSRRKSRKDQVQEPDMKSMDKNNAIELSLVNELALLAGQENEIRKEDCNKSSSDVDPDTTKNFNLANQRKNKDIPAKKPEVKCRDKNEAKEMALVNELTSFARQEENYKIKEEDNKPCGSESDSSATKILNLRSRRKSRKDEVQEPALKFIDKNDAKEILLANESLLARQDNEIRKEDCNKSSSDVDPDTTKNFNLANQRKNKDIPAKKPEVKCRDKNEAKEMALVNELTSFARQEENYKIKEEDNKPCGSESDSSATKILNLRSRRKSRKDQVQEPALKFIDKNDAKEILLANELSLLARQENEIRKEDCNKSSSDVDPDTTKNFNLRSQRKLVKKSEVTSNDNDLAKEMALVNELALFAEQEGKDEIIEDDCGDSFNSDLDTSLSLNSMNSRNTKKETARKPGIKTKPSSNEEIQCNNVDSTQQIPETVEKFTKSCSNDNNSIINKNRLLEYNEYVNNLYSKIKDSKVLTDPGKSINVSNICVSFDNSDEWDRSYSPVIQDHETTELIQCEPTLSFFQDGTGLENSIEKVKPEHNILNKNINKKTKLSPEKSLKWKCYPIDIEDTKLYQQAIVVLHKLPESFIESYVEFQNNNCDDTLEVDCSKNEGNEDIKSKIDIPVPYVDQTSKSITTPSKLLEDEQEIEEKYNVDSIKIEIQETSSKEAVVESKLHKIQRNIKADTETNLNMDEKKNVGQFMLTADKMMNKELHLLHSEPVLNNEPTLTVNHKSAKTSTKTSKSSITKGDDKMAEEDNSSSEEKQWVNTKVKMLKKLEKKQENSSVEEAKSAKIVSEFLEKHDDSEKRKKRQLAKRSYRSRRSILEQQKQLSVLTKELFGETSGESCPTGKKGSHSFGKGRRNIRKVIDKKSLARSTLIANMEELERKKRLLACRTKWKELLGCEDVLVVNGEVCLEYDFEENQSAVSIHPYFTSIMKAHQYDGVKFMWDACFESLAMIEAGYPGGGCILAHCMGLGKTLQVLALLHTVMNHPRVRMQRILVCCPLSTVLNWVDEIHKWIGPVTNSIKVFELSKLKKTYQRAYQLEDWYNGGGIFIIGYELFRNLTTLDPTLDRLRPTIVKKIRTALLDPGPDMVICDEGHLLKNDSSILAVAMSRVATKRRIVLTGTPMQNNLREYYCMVNFVKPNLLGRYSEYANRFENPIMNGQHRDSSEEDIKLMKQRTHILHKVLEGCLQRQEASVLYPYLPKKHEYTVFIPLTKCQSDLYKHYLNHYTRETKHSVLRDFHILQKIWTHPQVLHHFQMKMSDKNVNVKAEKLEDDLAHEELTAAEDVKPAITEAWWLQYLEGGDMLESLESSNKLLAVFRILEECTALDDKVLIFSTSLFTMDTLEYFLKRINGWSLGKEYYRLDGSVPAEVRQKWCREFNASTNVTTKLFLISTRAGCLGLNMTAANRVIILDTSWNPAHDVQSIFRVYRFGQKKDCYIYRLVALGTMEQKIYERAVTKQAVACRVIDEQQIDRHYNMEELTELYKFDESGSGVVAGVALGVTDVALLRVACVAPLHAVHEHDSLLRGSADQQLPEHERVAAWQQFEMEQTDKQMKNFGKQSLKTSYKRPHGHDYALSPTKAPCYNKSGENEKQNVNTKKERKKSFKDQIKLEEEPSTSKEKNSSSDDIHSHTVNKIKEILSQHNSDSNGDIDIETLLKSVKNLVFSGIKGGSTPIDALAENIAKVVLGSEIINNQSVVQTLNSVKQDIKSERQPASESSSTESQNEIDTFRNERTRTKHNRIHMKRRKSIKKECITETQSESDTSHLTKKKRKAALKAKEKLDSIDSEIAVNKSDDDEWTLEDNDSILLLKLKKQKNKSIRNSPDSEKELNKIVIDIKDRGTPVRREEPIIVEEKQASPQNEHSKTEISILVSDDDDETSNKDPKNSKDTENVKETEKNKETQKPDNNNKDTESNEDELVPLHPSLLKNPNFVKIVAHAYSSANDMLEEKAALLAAQYSTQNALREIESGRQIYSGPLYDIAIKAVGKSMLKKLQANVKSNDVTDSREKGIDRSPSASNVNFVGKKSTKNDDVKVYKANRSKAQSKKDVSSKRTQEREISSDSDDLVMLDSKANEPTCAPAKRSREKKNRKDSIQAKESDEGDKKVVVSYRNKNKRTTPPNATTPEAPSAATKVAPSIESEVRRRSYSSTPSVVDDDNDVRIVEEAPATEKKSPGYSALNTRPRNSQPLPANKVVTTPVRQPVDLKSSQAPESMASYVGPKTKMLATSRQVELSLIIPDINLDDDSACSAERTDTMKSSTAVQSSQMTSLKAKPPIASQPMEQYIIPDIDLDEIPADNTEQTKAMKIKNLTVQPTMTMTVSKIKCNEILTETKIKTPFHAQTVERPVIIPDIVLDDDDSPEFIVFEPIKTQNTPVKCFSVTKSDKQAADLKTKPKIHLNNSSEQRDTENITKINQSAKSIDITKVPSSTIVGAPIIIPDIYLDDDSNENSGEAEFIGATYPGTETSQKITRPAALSVGIELSVDPPLLAQHQIKPDFDQGSTAKSERTGAMTNSAKKSATGSHTICLDSDDEEAVVINERVIHSVQETKAPPPMSVAPAASTSNQPGPSNRASNLPNNTKNKDINEEGFTEWTPNKTPDCDLDEDISIIEQIVADSITKNKAKIAMNALKPHHKIGEVLKFPKKTAPEPFNVTPPSNVPEPGKKFFKVVKVFGSKETDDKGENKKADTKSDNDPLSILKDVIHIQADNFNTVNAQDPKPATSSTGSQSTSAESSAWKQKQVKAYGTPAKSTPNVLKTVAPSSVDLTRQDAGPSKDYPKKVVPSLGTKNNNGNMTLVFPKSTATSGPITIAGSAKDIVIGRRVEKIPSKPTTIDSTFKSTKKKIVLKLDNSQTINRNKRSTTSSETGPPKKTKPETYKQLTLKDFNIDDFDDIIELE